MNSFWFSLFLTLIALAHQSEGGTMWEKFNSGPKNTLICYKTLTLELFESLKEVVDESYIEHGKNEFESKVNPKNDFYSFFDQGDSNDEAFEKKKKEAEEIASQGISTIQQWLIQNCTNEKQEQVMKFIAIFKESCANCGDAKFLSTSIVLLEQACQENGKEDVTNGSLEVTLTD